MKQPKKSATLTFDQWQKIIIDKFIKFGSKATILSTVQSALEEYPKEPGFLFFAAVAALLEKKPSFALNYLKQFRQDYSPSEEPIIFEAIANLQIETCI
ncbi:hypothetical protein WDW89_20695 [Deltaproteobacteria bacterium TL4]